MHGDPIDRQLTRVLPGGDDSAARLGRSIGSFVRGEELLHQEIRRAESAAFANRSRTVGAPMMSGSSATIRRSMTGETRRGSQEQM